MINLNCLQSNKMLENFEFLGNILNGLGYDKRYLMVVVNQNLVNVTSAKYSLLRAFPENVKQLSSILTKIWRLEATYVIRF